MRIRPKEGREGVYDIRSLHGNSIAFTGNQSKQKPNMQENFSKR